ncbi:phospholipase D family protein [Herbaspirillum sp. SJZ107]|uniref:phospholipase D family protein n=1 Tax=Herbaspirillum sp. SJZ107 TaxID=2572881 RepID=UPI001153F44F|nr:phospholipase D family protein [Herbaspirillum sp. SJZ107]TQK06957.1 hypothetical protein FBX97_2222 [Herbaspirillum sp. SJZ107]
MFLESGRAIAAQVQLLVDQEVVQPVRFAVAFWGAGADFKLRGACRIICDLASGMCNPAVIASLLDRDNTVVLQLAGLHAKVVVGSAGAVISSANMSTNGLGAEGADASGTIEAGYFVTPSTSDHRRVAAWFEEQWAQATLISQDDLTAAAMRWADRNREMPALETISDRSSFSSFSIDPGMLLEPHIDPQDRLAAVKPLVFNVLKETLPDLDRRRLGKIATWACHLLLNRAGMMQEHGPGDGEARGLADDAWIYGRFGTTKRAETLTSVAALLASISRSTFFSRDIRRAAAEALREIGNDGYR